MREAPIGGTSAIDIHRDADELRFQGPVGDHDITAVVIANCLLTRNAVLDRLKVFVADPVRKCQVADHQMNPAHW